MASISACICFYNAAKELERCLSSLDLDKQYGIDNAICIDGKYPNFRGNTRYSNDGSREIVSQFPNTHLYNCADYEIHKRNYYLKVADRLRPDYILIIDSDEYVEPNKDWKLFRTNLKREQKENPMRDVWGLDIENNSNDYVETVEQILGRAYQAKKRHSWDMTTFVPKPRIWYKPWQIEYFLNHYTFRHKDPNYPEYLRDSVHGITMWNTIAGIRLLHDHKLRTSQYLDRRLEYHRWLIQFEQRKVGHYFKKHNYKPLPHDLSIIDNSIE